VQASPAATADARGRFLRDLRLSVTDACNLRCQYCLPAEIFGPGFRFLPRESLLSFDEMELLARAFHRLGLTKIRLTGGEPLLRPRLPELVARLRAISPHLELALTTNGLALEKHADALAAAGLERVNVSLDSLDDGILERMAGRKVRAESVLAGIRAALARGLSVKVNMVVKRGLNESQILPMTEYFRAEAVPLRFIEYMDAGNSNGWRLAEVVPGREILEMIRAIHPLERRPARDPAAPARVWEFADGRGSVGFINTVTEPFCGNCTRARVTAEGSLFTCIFAESGVDLRPWLNLDAEALSERLRSLWTKRDNRYSETRAATDRPAGSGSARPEMWRLGG
jgi:cyclic pyranopterin phosphate synthase